MNRSVIVGRLTKDPVVSVTPGGVTVARFTVAVNRTFKNKTTGEYEADFINCVSFRQQAEFIGNYGKKGAQVGVDGRIQTGSYEKDGVKIYTTEIVPDHVQLLEPKGSNNQTQGQSQSKPPVPAEQININDDDLPF